jgi:hypothetical protein
MMAETETPEGQLVAEFRELGKNLTEVLRTAWDQPERKRLQQEIANGLSELGSTLKDETRKFSDSAAGQRIKTDVENITQRVHSGEVELKVRQELLSALQMANEQLQRAVDRLGERQRPDTGAQRSSQEGQQYGASAGPAPSEQASSGQGNQGGSGVANPDKGTDRSSMDPATENRQEVHPDDVEAPPSDTGHREIHPDDVEA